MIDPSLDFVGLVSAALDGDEFHVRFKLSDGRECGAVWDHDTLRSFMTPRNVDTQPRPAPAGATLQ